MQNDFRIGISGEMVVSFPGEFFPKFKIIRKLSVEAKRKPLVLVNVLTFERLSLRVSRDAKGGKLR
jgi:hypothetical protein